MQEPQRPRRSRGRRRPPRRDRPTQAPAEPRAPRQGPAPARPDRARPDRGRPDRGRGRPRGGRGRGRPREAADEKAGTPAVILLDRREGEPDLTGSVAVFEGLFDPETGERRRGGQGVPRLRAGNERVWGTEVWWRLDPSGAGVTPADHAEIEQSKKLLRGLLRDARRAGRLRP